MRRKLWIAVLGTVVFAQTSPPYPPATIESDAAHVHVRMNPNDVNEVTCDLTATYFPTLEYYCRQPQLGYWLTYESIYVPTGETEGYSTSLLLAGNSIALNLQWDTGSMIKWEIAANHEVKSGKLGAAGRSRGKPPKRLPRR